MGLPVQLLISDPGLLLLLFPDVTPDSHVDQLISEVESAAAQSRDKRVKGRPTAVGQPARLLPLVALLIARYDDANLRPWRVHYSRLARNVYVSSKKLYERLGQLVVGSAAVVLQG